MDVNGVGQNAINISTYNSNSNISQYGETTSEVAIKQVQQVETKSSEVSEDKNKEYSKKDLDNALKKINNFMKDEHTRAEYSFHKDLGTLMIKIVNQDTKEVVLEVPPKKILDMVASMMKQVGLLDKRA